MQTTLPLHDGFDMGPLFAPVAKRRPPKMTRGWAYRYPLYQQRTPTWADADAMQAIYDHARQLTRETGTPHEVDHVVPLNHPLVCGLHCPANLQVLPHEVNRRKSNNWWPDMWGEQTDLLPCYPAATLPCYPS